MTFWSQNPQRSSLGQDRHMLYMWMIIIVCRIEAELLYRSHFFTDRQTEWQRDETSIPPQLRWRGYTNLFSMWRNRWKMTPWRSKFHGGSHFFTTFGSRFNVKIWPVSAFNVEKMTRGVILTLKNDPGSHFSTGSLFNVTRALFAVRLHICHTYI